MSQSKPRPLRRALSAIFICLFIGVVLFIVARTHREPALRNCCVCNLILLDGSKQQWALDHHKTNSDTPTWADLKAYLCRTDEDEFPKCPQGGTYTLRTVEEKPTC